jgi:hypothetical protein
MQSSDDLETRVANLEAETQFLRAAAQDLCDLVGVLAAYTWVTPSRRRVLRQGAQVIGDALGGNGESSRA